jgi:hypothetical protein
VEGAAAHVTKTDDEPGGSGHDCPKLAKITSVFVSFGEKAIIALASWLYAPLEAAYPVFTPTSPEALKCDDAVSIQRGKAIP